MIVRGKGYKLGFYTALALLAVVIALSETGLLTAVTAGFAAFAVLMASVTVFALYCISNGAFLAARDNGKRYIALFAGVAVLSGANTVRHAVRGGLIENGKLGFDGGYVLELEDDMVTIKGEEKLLFPKEGKNRYEWQPKPGSGYLLSDAATKPDTWSFREL